VILESTAVEEAAFSSYLNIGTSISLDLRRIMLKDRVYRPVLSKNKKGY
jgi:hypothetical protein